MLLLITFVSESKLSVTQDKGDLGEPGEKGVFWRCEVRKGAGTVGWGPHWCLTLDRKCGPVVRPPISFTGSSWGDRLPRWVELRTTLAVSVAGFMGFWEAGGRPVIAGLCFGQEQCGGQGAVWTLPGNSIHFCVMRGSSNGLQSRWTPILSSQLWLYTWRSRGLSFVPVLHSWAVANFSTNWHLLVITSKLI